MNGYELSRNWFDFAFDNPHSVNPTMGILYFYIIEYCNRMGWKNSFSFPSNIAMDAIGVRSYNTYIKALNELENLGFIKILERSKNQYTSNIIALVALSNFNKALDKALTKHDTKQRESTIQSTIQSTSSIIKQINNKQINNNNNNSDAVVADEIFVDYALEKEILESEIMCENLCYVLKITKEKLIQFAKEIFAEWKIRGQTYESVSDSKQHFINHIRKKISAERKDTPADWGDTVNEMVIAKLNRGNNGTDELPTPY